MKTLSKKKIKESLDSHIAKRINNLFMATRVQISCINKNDRQSAYERIAYVGGIHNSARWKMSLTDAIRDIENGKYSFYTAVNGHVRNVIVAKRLGTKYLRTEADSDTPDNLLSLPECP